MPERLWFKNDTQETLVRRIIYGSLLINSQKCME